MSHIGKLRNFVIVYKELGHFPIGNWFRGGTSTFPYGVRAGSPMCEA